MKGLGKGFFRSWGEDTNIVDNQGYDNEQPILPMVRYES
jgi:hypothetical protein